MPNGFHEDLNIEKDLRELEEIVDNDSSKEMFRFLGRRVIHLEGKVNHQCHERQDLCESKFTELRSSINNVRTMTKKQWAFIIAMTSFGCGIIETLLDAAIHLLQ